VAVVMHVLACHAQAGARPLVIPQSSLHARDRTAPAHPPKLFTSEVLLGLRGTLYPPTLQTLTRSLVMQEHKREAEEGGHGGRGGRVVGVGRRQEALKLVVPERPHGHLRGRHALCAARRSATWS